LLKTIFFVLHFLLQTIWVSSVTPKPAEFGKQGNQKVRGKNP